MNYMYFNSLEMPSNSSSTTCRPRFIINLRPKTNPPKDNAIPVYTGRMLSNHALKKIGIKNDRPAFIFNANTYNVNRGIRLEKNELTSKQQKTKVRIKKE